MSLFHCRFQVFIECLILIVVLQSETLLGTASKRARKASIKREDRDDGVCHYTSQFKFDPIEPTYNYLSYCTYLRPQTCCNRTHTDTIASIIYPYFEDNFTNDCREIGINIGCSSCDPRLGTREIIGFCPQLCDTWYDACNESYWQYDAQGKLIPCSQNNVVCTRLNEIVSNGIDMCSQAGYDINYKSIECYNGTLPNLKHISSYFDENGSTWNKQLLRALNSFALRLERMPMWQQLLILITILYFIYFVLNWCVSQIVNKFCPSEVVVEDDNDLEDLEIKKQELRNKRLDWLKKQQIEKSENVERDLAKFLAAAGDEVVKESLQELANKENENLSQNKNKTKNKNDDENENDNEKKERKIRKKRKRNRKMTECASKNEDGYSAEQDIHNSDSKSENGSDC